MVYDLQTKQLTLLDTRNGKPFNDGAMGTYLYGMDWTPDGKEFLFHTTNRKQDIMEYKDLQEYISSLDSAKDLKIIEAEVDPILEITEIAS